MTLLNKAWHYFLTP
uniref:Uncharacterized protein n=1 Tax=Lepeophtheirus salmonis TaxID=72036 RepID=A0A0K2TFZ9_LEPSM